MGPRLRGDDAAFATTDVGIHACRHGRWALHSDQTGTVIASYANSQSKTVRPLSGGYSRSM
jgi:hypothetical protein